MENPPATPPAKKPWPMIWIVAAIAGYVIVYTVVNVAFRKPAPAHEPWAEAQERRHRVFQTSMMGWTRLAAEWEPAATSAEVAPPPAAVVSSTPPPARLDKALPIELVLIAPGRPALHAGPDLLRAPASVSAGSPLRLQLEFSADVRPGPLGETLAYAKDRHLYVFLQDATRVAVDAAPVEHASRLDLVLSPPQLAPGPWQAELHTTRATFRWEFTVP